MLELIVSIVVLSVLAALALPSYLQLKTDMKLKVEQSDLASFSRETLAVARSQGQSLPWLPTSKRSSLMHLPRRAATRNRLQ